MNIKKKCFCHLIKKNRVFFGPKGDNNPFIDFGVYNELINLFLSIF